MQAIAGRKRERARERFMGNYLDSAAGILTAYKLALLQMFEEFRRRKGEITQRKKIERKNMRASGSRERWTCGSMLSDKLALLQMFEEFRRKKEGANQNYMQNERLVSFSFFSLFFSAKKKLYAE